MRPVLQTHSDSHLTLINRVRELFFFPRGTMSYLLMHWPFPLLTHVAYGGREGFLGENHPITFRIHQNPLIKIPLLMKFPLCLLCDINATSSCGHSFNLLSCSTQSKLNVSGRVCLLFFTFTCYLFICDSSSGSSSSSITFQVVPSSCGI